MAISVLLPYRDAGATLDEALASTLADLGPYGEVVTIDDGSRDDGPSRVEAWARRDGRVVPVRGDGRGVAHALALGAATARHALLARMDADDVTLPGRFAAQLAAMDADPTLALVATRVEAFPDPGEGTLAYLAWQNGLVTPEDHARNVFVEAPVCHPSVLLRREALARVGGYRDTPWPEDWDLWLRLVDAGLRIAKVPRVFLRWRRHPATTTARDPRCAPPRLRAARAHYLAPRLAARGAPFAIWGAGQTGRRLARALAQHGERPAFFVDIDPRKIGRRAQGAPIVAAEEAIAAVRDGGPMLVVAVGDRGARAVVEARLALAGLVAGRDFVAAA